MMPYSDWIEPAWVEDGMKIIAPYNLKGTGVWCTVAAAAGMFARVINERHGIDRWYHIGYLRVSKDDKHACR